ncbi:hypothetical protein L7F22_058220 [Adiantum nelumboides]|nr:hypothetical protein [Adiantum nelumboides]
MVTIASPSHLHSDRAELPERVVIPSWQPGTADLPSLVTPNDLPSPESFLSLVHDCREAKELSHSQNVHLQICAHGFDSLRPLENYLVPMFVECGSLPIAQQVFNRLNHQNEYSWTSLIQGWVNSGNLEVALSMLEPMQAHAIIPSSHTFVALLKACSQLKSLDSGLELHHSILLLRQESHPFICNTLVDMYANCGAFAEAMHVFENFTDRDIVSWTALIALCADQGHANKALQSLDRMVLDGISPNTHTIVCCLSACEKMDDVGIVQYLFKEVTNLQACGVAKATSRGRAIHREVVKRGYERVSFIGNCLVDMYVKCAELAEAKLLTKDVISWTSLMAGYWEHGLGGEAFQCIEEMQLEGVSPDAITFVCSLKACVSSQSLTEGQTLHAEVVKEGFEENAVIVRSLADLYSQCGMVLEAKELKSCEGVWQV